MVQQVKELVWLQVWHRSQLQLRFGPWTRNFHMPWVRPQKTKKKTKTKAKTKKPNSPSKRQHAQDTPDAQMLSQSPLRMATLEFLLWQSTRESDQ